MTGKDAPEPMRLIGAPAPEPVVVKHEPGEKPILEVRNLITRFPVKGGFFRRTVAWVHAVEDVSFDLPRGETLSLVGESGCGKSSAGRSILRLVEPMSGEIRLEGRDVMAFGPGMLRQARADMQMVFQDPFASLNPMMRLTEQVAEPMKNFGKHSKSEIDDRVAAGADLHLAAPLGHVFSGHHGEVAVAARGHLDAVERVVNF